MIMFSRQWMEVLETSKRRQRRWTRRVESAASISSLAMHVNTLLLLTSHHVQDVKDPSGRSIPDTSVWFICHPDRGHDRVVQSVQLVYSIRANISPAPADITISLSAEQVTP
jgi:hypothetical protein